MAKITVNRVPVPAQKPAIKEVDITLSKHEAEELMAILGCGADLVDGLYFKLLSQGVRYSGDSGIKCTFADGVIRVK